jgi:predicted N-acetyltransferase YhbS
MLRILLVDPAAQGRGIGHDLVRTCLDFARRAGYQRMVLWTNDVLVSARRIYQAFGFALVEEQPHHSFGRDLVGQTWMVQFGQPLHDQPMSRMSERCCARLPLAKSDEYGWARRHRDVSRIPKG